MAASINPLKVTLLAGDLRAVQRRQSASPLTCHKHATGEGWQQMLALLAWLRMELGMGHGVPVSTFTPAPKRVPAKIMTHPCPVLCGQPLSCGLMSSSRCPQVIPTRRIMYSSGAGPLCQRMASECLLFASQAGVRSRSHSYRWPPSWWIGHD